MKIYLKVVLVFIACYFVSYPAMKAQDLTAAIQNKSFKFMAQSMMPLKAATRFVDPGYGFTVQGDTLVSNLPYIGRAYMADIGSSQGPLDFTSYKFDYSIKSRKKGGLVVQIKVKDTKGQQRFNLTVHENGTAMLNVSSVDRESISYNGRVESQ